MKRLPRVLLIVPAVLLAAALLSAPAFHVASHVFGTVATQVLKRVAVSVGDVAVRAAEAQETLEFKPVPPESTAELERGRSRRAAPAAPAAPAVPTPPTPPAAPEAPTRVRSGDIMRVGSDIHIPVDQSVLGDVLAIRGDVTVAGHVEGNVVSVGGDVTLEATARVDGDVVCMGGRLEEEDGAVVGGQRVTALDRETRRSRTRIDFDHDLGYRMDEVIGRIAFYLVLLGLVWGITMLAPGSTNEALAAVRSHPARSLGIGFLGWLLFVPSVIALVLVVAILCITIIGIPLAIIALLGYFVFFALLILWGYAVGAAFLGENLLKRRGEAAPTLSRMAVAGVIVLGSASVLGEIFDRLDFVPLVGAIGALITAVVVLTSIVLTSMGAGAWLHTQFTTGALGRWWRGPGARFRPGGGGSNGGSTPGGPAPPSGGGAPTATTPTAPPATGGTVAPAPPAPPAPRAGSEPPAGGTA